MKHTIAIVLTVFSLFGLPAATNAAPLPIGIHTPLAGTDAVSRPELAGTIVDSITTPFSIGGSNITGNLESRVIRESVAGTLDFYWRITVDPTSTGGGIQVFRIDNFAPTQIFDGDWRHDGPGSTPVTWVYNFDPLAQPQGAINVYYTSVPNSGELGIPPGNPASNLNGSYWFFLHTSATQYAKTASFDLVGGNGFSGVFANATFAPAVVPEPTTLMLIVMGGLVLLPSRWQRSCRCGVGAA